MEGHSAVNIPIILSFFGFFCAALLLMPGGCGYHDLILANKRQLVDSVLNERIEKLRPLYLSLLPKKDSPAISNEFNTVRNSLEQSLIEKTRLDSPNSDTSLKYYATYICADRYEYYHSVAELSESQKKNDTLHVPVIVLDSPAFGFDTFQGITAH